MPAVPFLLRNAHRDRAKHTVVPRQPGRLYFDGTRITTASVAYLDSFSCLSLLRAFVFCPEIEAEIRTDGIASRSATAAREVRDGDPLGDYRLRGRDRGEERPRLPQR